uniref:Ig-like domain-containing protein n=1 Tax=Latimeria chalumnae TaxID=7897 RepID=H2ZU88_LATCH
TLVCQTAEPKVQFNWEIDEDELVRVDIDKQKMEWRLPEFKGHKIDSLVEWTRQNIPICEHNLDLLIKRTNGLLGKTVPPEVTMYPENQVEFGKANILICFMDNFYPPVLNFTWYKNGNQVSEGFYNTDFYSKVNYRFRKFSYLNFTPEVGDIYSCQVEHWGLEEPINKFWEPEEPPSTSEVTGTVVCAFGLALGLVGVAVGTVLLIKGMKRNQSTQRYCKA